MKRFLSALLAFVLVATPVASTTLPLTGAGAGSVDITPVSNACINSSGTTITFTAQGIGKAAATRTTIVSINWDDSTLAGTAELTAMTVGGVSMIRAVRAVGDDQNSNAEIWYASNPTGTSANIVATFSTAVDGITIEVYSLVGYNTFSTSSATGTTSASLAYTNKQVAIASASRRTNVSTSLSNLTNNFSSACGSSLWGVHASGRQNGNGTLTTTISPTSSTPLIALAFWTQNVDCTTPTNAFLSRAQTARGGTPLDATHTTAFSNLICYLVSNNIWNSLDVLQIYATQDSASAVLNLVSSNFTAVTHGSPAFVADRGFTGVNGSSVVYIDTAFNANTGTNNYTRNSAHLSTWVVTNVATASPSAGMFDGGGTVSEYLYSKFNGDNNAYFRINVAAAAGQSVANSDATGHYIGDRPDSTHINGFRNGVSILAASAQNSVALANFPFFAIAGNSSASAQGAAQQQAMFSAGASLGATGDANLYTGLRIYMTAVGVP